MLKRAIILASMNILFISLAYPQSVSEVDRETYQLYLQQDWKQLIKKGKEAKKTGIDFYYLKYRMGIAYYSIKDYRASIPYFKAVYETNKTDSKLIEYIYYAYLFSGQTENSKIFAAELTETQKQTLLGCNPKKLSEVKLQYSYQRISDESILNAENIESNIESTDLGFQQIPKEFNSINLGLTHEFSPKISLNHAYTNLGRDDFYYLRTSTDTTIDENWQTTQNQYYFNLNFHPGLNFNIHGGIHYLSYKYPTSETITTQRYGRKSASTQSQTQTESNMVYHFGMDYRFYKFDLGISSSIANLSGNNQFQKDFSAIYYPLGNLNLYSVSSISHYSDKGSDETKNNWVIFQKVGWGVKNKVWVEPFMMLGNIRNFTSAKSQIVYNSLDNLKELYGCNLIIPIMKNKIQFNLNYSNSNYESSFYESTEGELNKKIIYHHHSISGGILWNI